MNKIVLENQQFQFQTFVIFYKFIIFMNLLNINDKFVYHILIANQKCKQTEIVLIRKIKNKY